MDSLERLAATATDVAVVIGNPHTNEFRIVRLDSLPLAPETRSEYQARGFEFLAAFGKLDGDHLQIECEPNIGEDRAKLIIRAIPSYVCVPAPIGSRRNDGAEWLRKLWELPDTRNDFGPA